MLNVPRVYIVLKSADRVFYLLILISYLLAHTFYINLARFFLQYYRFL